jgi:hypothetical protein
LTCPQDIWNLCKEKLMLAHQTQQKCTHLSKVCHPTINAILKKWHHGCLTSMMPPEPHWQPDAFNRNELNLSRGVLQDQ